ncbi:MAG TPA: hypothetical protein VFM00_01875 [Candidatus Eisenbacteria bacterium]|nr:hypothetical protein [Candidatus Eisenbacteria bacterium]
MPQTSTKRRSESKSDLLESETVESTLERARRRIREGYYDRAEVRRTLATLILHRAARKTLA